MPRKSYRRGIKSYNRDKYSKENFRVQIATGAQQVGTTQMYQGGQTIVAPTTIQGMRKVKHITVSMTRADTDLNAPFHWALVYVPEGYTANPLRAAGTSLYEPNQYVMACGLIDPDAGPIRIRCPVSRNLNSGDSISLVIGSFNAEAQYYGVVSYAITLQ